MTQNDDGSLRLHMLGPCDPRFERCMNIMGKMLGAAGLDQRTDDLDPAEHTSITMTAASFLVGYLTGASIVAGVLNEADKGRIGKAMQATYRQGIRVGRDTALASMQTEGSA